MVVKSDGENAIVAVREVRAGCHGGRIVPEVPAKSESQ